MSKFPEPVPLDRKVTRARLSRRKTLLQTASRGVVIRGLIIAAELMGAFFFGSSALLLDALACSLDVLASFSLIFCIRIADNPPDKEHPLGHGRFEPIAGLLIGFLLVILGLFSVFEQGKALLFPSFVTTESFHYVWLIPLGAVVLLEMSYQMLKKAAKRENSPALHADAIHYRIDSLGSLFALIALLLAAFYPASASLFDHGGALLIALFMVGTGWIASKKNIHQLLDQSPSEKYYDRVKRAALSVDGVLATEKMRLQVYGPDAHVAIDIEVDPLLTVAASHRVTQKVRRAIQLAWPAVRDVIVHVEPYYPGDHDA